VVSLLFNKFENSLTIKEDFGCLIVHKTSILPASNTRSADFYILALLLNRNLFENKNDNNDDNNNKRIKHNNSSSIL